MDFVTERIAVGGRKDAENVAVLREQGITAVLNVAWDLDIVYPRRSEGSSVFALEYQKVGLIDGRGNHPGTLLAAVWILSQLLERHQRVLVHCHAGVSRSATVVALYLATFDGKSFREGIQEVRKHRPFADPHRELIQLAWEVEEMFLRAEG